jgi:hypothetical protein
MHASIYIFMDMGPCLGPGPCVQRGGLSGSRSIRRSIYRYSMNILMGTCMDTSMNISMDSSMGASVDLSMDICLDSNQSLENGESSKILQQAIMVNSTFQRLTHEDGQPCLPNSDSDSHRALPGRTLASNGHSDTAMVGQTAPGCGRQMYENSYL